MIINVRKLDLSYITKRPINSKFGTFFLLTVKINIILCSIIRDTVTKIRFNLVGTEVIRVSSISLRLDRGEFRYREMLELSRRRVLAGSTVYICHDSLSVTCSPVYLSIILPSANTGASTTHTPLQSILLGLDIVSVHSTLPCMLQSCGSGYSLNTRIPDHRIRSRNPSNICCSSNFWSICIEQRYNKD